jgi:hypothetical protein
MKEIIAQLQYFEPVILQKIPWEYADAKTIR